MMDKHKFIQEWFERNNKQQQAEIAKARRLAGLAALEAKVHDEFVDKVIERAKERPKPVKKMVVNANGVMVRPLQLRMWNEYGFGLVEKKAPGKPFAGAHGFIYALQKKGFVQLGSGGYSTVLSHPKSPDKVLKVLRSDHDGWLPYVTWANQNGYGGTFAPKVYSYKWINKGNFGLAVMEKLDKTFHSVDQGHEMMIVPSLIQYQGNKTCALLADLVVPGLGRFLTEVRTKVGIMNDAGGSNMMLRKDGSLVITDPMSSTTVLNAGVTFEYKKRRKSSDLNCSSCSDSPVMLSLAA